MEKIKFCFVAVVLSIVTNVFAQTTSKSDGFNSLFIQWNPSTIKPSEGESTSFTGFSLGYNHDFNLVKDVPLFLEVGAALQYSYKSKDQTLEEDKVKAWGLEVNDYRMWTEKISLLSVKVPINILYKHYFPNSNIAIAPYIGVSVRGNIFGRYKVDVNKDLKVKVERMIASVTTASGWTPFPLEKDFDLFSKSDMGEDNVWKRFQIGWQVGANVYFYKFYAGVSYGNDFTEISNECKIRTISAMIGYVF